MTLSGMAGKDGAALAGAVMNTVQTGSVPAETAGQAGNPNTGSQAGDAQGDETAGTAGSPEEGGATKPDGSQKPADIPKQPPAPGPKEASGGATGAGGTDVAAGGGAAGATEAVAGQSAQDGGPGGPGDGKVTSGNVTITNRLILMALLLWLLQNQTAPQLNQPTLMVALVPVQQNQMVLQPIQKPLLHLELILMEHRLLKLQTQRQPRLQLEVPLRLVAVCVRVNVQQAACRSCVHLQRKRIVLEVH